MQDDDLKSPLPGKTSEPPFQPQTAQNFPSSEAQSTPKEKNRQRKQ